MIVKIAILSVAIVALFSQEIRKPSFEVASIKPAPASGGMRGGVFGGPGSRDPCRWSSINTTLKSLMIQAYGLKSYECAGPAWVGQTRFDVEARLPANTNKEQFNLMLQSLLEERFQVAFHREPAEISAWDLVVGKGGPKLKGPADEKPETGDSGRKGIVPLESDRDGYPLLSAGMHVAMVNGRSHCHFGRTTMGEFAKILSSQVDQPVFDGTGLGGEYELTCGGSMSGDYQPMTPEQGQRFSWRCNLSWG